jgi:hypothetical protein
MTKNDRQEGIRKMTCKSINIVSTPISPQKSPELYKLGKG